MVQLGTRLFAILTEFRLVVCDGKVDCKNTGEEEVLWTPLGKRDAES